MLKRLSILLFPAILLSCSNLNSTKEKDYIQIHEEVFTIDSHTDTPLHFTRSNFAFGEKHDYKKDRSRVDIPRMEEGGLDGIFLAVFNGQGERTPEAYKKVLEYSVRIFDSIYAVADKYKDKAEIATTPEDGYRIENEGKRALFIGMENGYPVGEDLNNLVAFKEMGANYITLCHSKNNQICDSSTDTTEHNGLSTFGEEVVKEMNRLGIMIDVSHISDSSFYDVIELSEVPVIASHSCARAICDSPRNLTDDMLIKLSENEGVIQLCILSDYVKKAEIYPLRDSLKQAVRDKYNNFKGLSDEQWEDARRDWYAVDSIAPKKLASVSDAIDHIDHIVALIGIDHIGIGTDFDGGGGLVDCVDVSELPEITRELVARGYSQEEIRKIWGENLMRVMGEVQIIKN